jgi:hypothetical protein
MWMGKSATFASLCRALTFHFLKTKWKDKVKDKVGEQVRKAILSTSQLPFAWNMRELADDFVLF